MVKSKKNETPHDKQATINKQPKWGPLSAVLVSFAVYIGSQIVAAFGIGLYAVFKGLDASQIEELLRNSTIAQFLFFLITAVSTILFIWQYLKIRGLKWSDIGLKKPSSGNLMWALPTFGVYFITLIAVVGLLSNLIPEINMDQEQQIGFKQATGVVALSMVFISLVILPAVVEEILVRGFLYGGLVKKFSKLAAALIASVLFGIAHLQLGSGASPLWIAAIDTFVLSMFLIWLREKTGNIYAGMLVHAIKNSLAFASIFIFHLN